jgi:hypothetical protein
MAPPLTEHRTNLILIFEAPILTMQTSTMRPIDLWQTILACGWAFHEEVGYRFQTSVAKRTEMLIQPFPLLWPICRPDPVLEHKPKKKFTLRWSPDLPKRWMERLKQCCRQTTTRRLILQNMNHPTFWSKWSHLPLDLVGRNHLHSLATRTTHNQ